MPSTTSLAETDRGYRLPSSLMSIGTPVAEPIIHEKIVCTEITTHTVGKDGIYFCAKVKDATNDKWMKYEEVCDLSILDDYYKLHPDALQLVKEFEVFF